MIEWMNEWMIESWDIFTNVPKQREPGINITTHFPSSWIITLINRSSEIVYVLNRQNGQYPKGSLHRAINFTF